MKIENKIIEKQSELIARYEYANENKILFTRKYLQDIRDEISTLRESSKESEEKDYDSINVKFPIGKTSHKGTLNKI